jgi:hypothetical protein
MKKMVVTVHVLGYYSLRKSLCISPYKGEKMHVFPTFVKGD